VDSNLLAALIGAGATVVAAVITVLGKRHKIQPPGNSKPPVAPPPPGGTLPVKPPTTLPDLEPIDDEPEPDLEPEPAGGESTWKHAEVFPIIAQTIEEAYRQEQRYFTSREIASRLLRCATTRPIIEAAQRSRKDNATLDHVARNMVAWFTKRFVELGLDQRFDKAKIKRQTAYRPKDSSD
jgi:hypothetical protein